MEGSYSLGHVAHATTGDHPGHGAAVELREESVVEERHGHGGEGGEVGGGRLVRGECECLGEVVVVMSSTEPAT